MPIQSTINLKYGNLRDELMPLVMGEIPTGAEYEFRRMLKEAQNLLINEATVTLDSYIQRVETVANAGDVITLQNGEDSILLARTGSGRQYTIISLFSFNPVSGSTHGYAYPLLVDMGIDENGLRKYKVMNGEHARQEGDSPSLVGNDLAVYMQISLAPLSGNIRDDNYWSDDLTVIPNCYPAFKSMLLYVRFMELGNTAQALDYYSIAVKTLNDSLRKTRQGTLITPRIVQNLGTNQPNFTCPM